MYTTEYTEMYDYDTQLLLELGNAPDIPIKRHWIYNIFGRNKKEDKKKDKEINDSSYLEIYEYYYNGGFGTIIAKSITEILSLVFGIVFFIFVFIALNWTKILQCGNNNDIIDCGEIHTYVEYQEPNFFHILVLSFCVVFTVVKIFLFVEKYSKLKYMKSYYNNVLKISEKNLHTTSWVQIINEVSNKSQTKLSIKDITGIIMRKENFYISLIDKDVIGLNFYTKQLEINLHYIILNDIENISADKLKRRFVIYGLFNILLSLFIFIYQFVFFFVTNIDEFYKNKSSIGSRKYSPHTLYKFRDYNELDHFFEKRINKSIKLANQYITQFPSPIVEVICKFICLICGTFMGFLLILSLLDESILLYVRLFDRSLIFYTGLIGTVSAFARNYIVPPENSVYNPKEYLKVLCEKIHYSPLHWNKRYHTIDVRNEFLVLFPYVIVLFLKDLLSVVLTPIILIFILPRKSEEISNFIKMSTIYDANIGNVSSFTLFNTKIIDEKMKTSMSEFDGNHSFLEELKKNNMYNI